MKKGYIEKVVSIVNEAIEEVDVTLAMCDEELQLIGLDSISFIRMIVMLEDEFCIEFPDEVLYMENLNTINRIINVMEPLLES